ncbi:MAG TPA: VOC family protein [Anaerolineales bacterium]|nr:VOC family protein [Anaerolineales bacterium]
MKHVDTIVLVEDICRSKAFYVDILGLEILHDWETMVIFRERFSIHQADRLLPKQEATRFYQSGKQGRGNAIVYFEVDDLQTTYADMQAKGVEIIHGIVQLPQQKIFRMADPDGHIIEIGEPF